MQIESGKTIYYYENPYFLFNLPTNNLGTPRYVTYTLNTLDNKLIYQGKTTLSTVRDNKVYVRDILTSYVNKNYMIEYVNMNVIKFKMSWVATYSTGQTLSSSYTDITFLDAKEQAYNSSRSIVLDGGTFAANQPIYYYNYTALANGEYKYFKNGEEIEGEYACRTEYTINDVNSNDKQGNMVFQIVNGAAVHYEKKVFVTPPHNGEFIIFVNQYGCLDSIPVNIVSKKSVSVERKSYINNDTNIVYHTTATDAIAVKTLRMKDSDYKLVRALIMSNQVWIKDMNNFIHPIYVDSNSIEQKTFRTDKIYQYEFNIKYAKNIIN